MQGDFGDVRAIARTTSRGLILTNYSSFHQCSFSHRHCHNPLHFFAFSLSASRNLHLTRPRSPALLSFLALFILQLYVILSVPPFFLIVLRATDRMRWAGGVDCWSNATRLRWDHGGGARGEGIAVRAVDAAHLWGWATELSPLSGLHGREWGEVDRHWERRKERWAGVTEKSLTIVRAASLSIRVFSANNG